jgi:hypothetical protein
MIKFEILQQNVQRGLGPLAQYDGPLNFFAIS